MGGCCSSRRSWKLHLEVVGDEGKIERKPYKVELVSKDGCCNSGEYVLNINDEMRKGQIYDNLCSPLCCSGGAHEWEDKGHFFRVELPSLCIKDNLYVDGYEVKTKRDIASTWLCQFATFLIFGALIFIGGVVMTALSPEFVGWSSSRYFGISCLAVGFLTMLPGVIGLARAQSVSMRVKKYKDLDHQRQQEDTTQL